MGSGCLKPPSPPAELNLSSLDSIYEDIRQQNYTINSTNQQNLHIYKQINDRITKNGKLKKLCDYLSSHRHCICETVLHCNRLISQSKCYAHKYVSIIVLDAIFNIGPKLTHVASKKGITQISLIQYNSSRAVSVNGSYRESAVRTLINKEQKDKQRSIGNNSTNINKRKMMPTETTQNQPKTTTTTTVNELTSPIFESNYFNILNLLIQQDGLLYKLSLQNLIKYCYLCETPVSGSSTQPHNKFGNKTYINQVMKDISYHIQANNQMGISLKCYRVMLARMREEYFNSNVDFLGVLIDLWLSASASSVSSVDNGHDSLPINSTKNIVLLQNNLSLPEQTEQLVQIIELFLSQCIEQYQNNTIIEELFKILDKYKYTNVNKIQNILFDAIEGNQLKRQFYKKLMVNLLAYVAYPESSSYGGYEYGSSVLRDQSRFFDSTRTNDYQDNINNMHVLQKQWIECYNLGSPSSFAKKYKNIKCTECKLSCLAKINKWIFTDKIVSIEELLMYSGLCLLNAFIFNLYTEDQAVKDKVVVELKSFIGSLWHQAKGKYQHHHEGRDLMLEIGNMLMIQIQQNHVYDDHVRYTLLSIWQSVIDKQKQLTKLQQNHGHIILPISLSYCYENNVKIIGLMSMVLSKISGESVRMHLDRVCMFYDSVYKEILTGFTNGEQKIRLIDQFARCFVYDTTHSKKGGRVILKGVYAAFLEKLTKIASKKQNTKEQIQQCYVYFLDYLIYIIAKILDLGIASPNLLEYKSKILNTRDSQQLAVLEQYNGDRVPLQISLPNKQDLQLYKESFEYFRINQSVEYEMTGTGSVFWKGTRSVESFGSKDSTYTKGDKQLEDVLDILRL